ncbi:hypothetical protein ACT7TO_002890 [Vibrio cholerae]
MKQWLALSICLVSFVAFGKQTIPQDSQDRAKSMAQSVNQQMGSGENIRRFAANPLTTDDQMSTFDGKKNFDFKLQCKGSNKFLNMMVQPKSNGNLTLRTIQQDTSMNGEFDTVLTPNYEMTGICSNGFLKCDNPATGEGCTSYKWTASSNAMLGTIKVPLSDMGGCYCISGSCGSNLAWNNLDLVLKDLAVGASSALSQINPFYTITDVKVQDVTVSVSGSNGGSCSAATADGVGGTQELKDIANANYQSNPQKLTTDGYAAANSNTWYNNIQNSMKNQDYTTSQCSIKRHLNYDRVTIEDIIALDSGSSSSGGVYIYDDETARIVLGREGDNYWAGHCKYYTERTSFYIKRPELIRSAVLKKAYFDDWIQVSLNGSHIWNGPYGNWTSIGSPVPGACELSTSWRQNINKNFTNLFTKEGRYSFDVRVEVSGNGEGYVVGEVKVNPKCEMLDDVITNGCRAQQEDKDCTLLEEVVDGVTTFRNGHSTGLSPLPSNGGVYCGQPQIRDWFERKRTYQCKSNSNVNWSEGIKRVESVKSTINDDGDFVDRRTEKNGNIIYENGKVDFFDMGSNSCIKSCKTRKKRPAPEIALESPTSDKQVTDDAYDFFYHQCTTDDVCPTGTDEEIVKDCGCLNDFSEAAAAMQVLRLVGKDMICSDGTRGKL